MCGRSRSGSFTATFTFRKMVKGEVHFTPAEWEPRMPRPGELSTTDLDAYRRGRDSAYLEAARLSGLDGNISS